MAVSLVGVSNQLVAGSSNNNAVYTVTVPGGDRPALPAGAAAGDRIYINVIGFGATAMSFQTPADWLELTDQQPGGLTVPATASYYRDYDGVWTMPQISTDTVSDPAVYVQAIALRKGAGETWSTPLFSVATVSTAVSSWSATGSSSIALPTGGYLMAIAGNGGSTRTYSNPGLSASGATIGTVTNHLFTGDTTNWPINTSTGDNISGLMVSAPITTGATAAPTFSATLSGTSVGSVLMVAQGVTGGGGGPVVREAALSGSGTLSATQRLLVSRNAGLTGSGTLSTTTRPIVSQNALLSGSGTLTATVTKSGPFGEYLGVTGTTLTVTGLTPGTAYDVKVRAQGTMGTSEWSELVRFRTQS